jgi:hypothetical protein
MTASTSTRSARFSTSPSLVSGGSASAGKLGEAANAARAGEVTSIGRAAAAIDRGGVLGRYADKITAPRDILTPEGYGFQLNQGRTPLMRSMQRLADRIGAANPDRAYLGNRARADRAFARTQRYRKGEYLAEVRGTENAFARLSKDERFAFHLKVEGSGVPETFTDSWHTYQSSPSAALRRYIERLTGKKIGEVKRIVDEGGDPVAGSPVDALVRGASSPEMTRALEAGRALEAKGGKILEDAGVLTPETRAARQWLSQRLRSGGRHQGPRTVHVTPYDMLAEERKGLRGEHRTARSAQRAADQAAEKANAQAARLADRRAAMRPLETPPEVQVVHEARLAQEQAARELQIARDRYYGVEANSDSRIARREPVGEAEQHLRAANAELRAAEAEMVRYQRAGARHVDRAMQAEADTYRYETKGLVSAHESRLEKGAQKRAYHVQTERERIDKGFSAAYQRVKDAKEKRVLAEHARDAAHRARAMVKEREVAHRKAEAAYHARIREHDAAITRHQRATESHHRRASALAAAQQRAAEAARVQGETAKRVAAAQDAVRKVEEDLSYLPEPSVTETRAHHLEEGLYGGRTIQQLETERWMEMNGLKSYDVHPDAGMPTRFPHLGSERRPSGLGTGAPLRPVAAPAATKLNRGVRLVAARFITNPTAITRDFLATMGYRLVLDYRDYLTNFAKPLDHATGDGLSDGHVYFFDGVPGKPKGATLKRETRESDAMMRESVGLDKGYTDGQLQRLSREIVWRKGDAMPERLQSIIQQGDRELTLVQQLDALGVKQIPDRYAKNFLREFKQTDHLILRLFDRFTDVWRALVLQYRPAWLVYNIVGQHLLWMINYAGPAGARAYLDALRLEKDPSGAEWLRLRKFAIAKRRFKWAALIDDIKPGAMFGSFSREQQLGAPAIWLGDGAIGRALDESLNSDWTSRHLPVKAVNLGVQTVKMFGDTMSHLNLTIADDLPRRAAFLQEARRDVTIKRIRRQAKLFEGANLSLEEALRRTDRGTLERLVQRVDDALGNFTDMGAFERNVIRRAIPFYSWFKVITKLTLKLGLEHPGRVRMLNLMVVAAGTNPSVLPGFAVPSYLQGAIALGAPGADGQSLLATSAINPFATPVQMAQIIQSLVPYMHTDATGKTQVTPFGTESPFGVLSPAAGALAAAEGKDLFYGGDYKGMGAGRGPVAQGVGYFSGLPEIRLAEQLGLVGNYQSKLYDPNASTGGVNNYIWNYLGLPVKQVNRSEAESRARAGQ